MKRFTYRSTLAFRPVTISGVDVVRQVIGHQLADTTGMANPKRVRQRVKAVLDLVQRGRLTLHQCDGGFRCRRAPVRFVPRGLGGCPFAPGGVGAMSAQRPPCRTAGATERRFGERRGTYNLVRRRNF